jgi:LPS-assembly protein
MVVIGFAGRTLTALRTFLFFILCVVLWPAAAAAQNPFANCEDWQLTREQSTYDLVPGSDSVRAGRLSGNVTIRCDGKVLQAEEIWWRTDSPMAYAEGDVFFSQDGTEVSAQRAELNRDTQLGVFLQASGMMELLSEPPDRTLFGTQEPYIIFWGDEIEKVASDRWVLRRGGFTSCVQPTPRWTMTAARLTLVPGEHAILRNMVLSVKDVPLFYLPALYYPINKEDRATGFLLPTYGASTVRGFSLNNAFFWAIDRSQDATFYHDFFARAGLGLGGEYRYVADARSQGNARMYMLDERAQLGPDGETILRPAHRSFDFRGSVNHALPRGVRVAGNVNYFTDISTQQIYQQSIYDLSNRTRSFRGTVAGGTGRYRLSGQFERTDVFYGTDASRYGSAPVGTFAVGEKPIGRSPIYLSANFTGGHLVRQDDITDPTTNRSLWRLDGGPTISAPLSNMPALTVTASAALRYTYWTESLNADGLQVGVPISRQLLDLSTRAVGPVFSRIYRTPDNGYADGFKHLIEPSVTVGWLSAYDNSASLVQLDGVDTLVGGTTTLNYGLTNRLLAKRPTGASPESGQPTGVVREILTVDVRQTYYTNALAAQFDPQYQSSSFGDVRERRLPPSPFSPVQISATTRPTETASAQFRMEYDTRHDAVRTYGASGTLESRVGHVTAGWSKQQIIPGLSGFEDPSRARHFLNLSADLWEPNNRFGGVFAFNYDMLRQYFLQRRYRFYYNSQCCGLAVDFQTVDLSHFGGLGVPNDRRLAISFTLAGIGTFASPLGSFGGNTGSR